MQEEYKRKLEQEIQQYILTHTSILETGSTQTIKDKDDRITSQREALETAKQRLHETRGESRTPEMDWDYYEIHAYLGEQSRLEGEMVGNEKGKVEGKGISKRAASTPLEGEEYPHNYTTFGLSTVERRYSCENCQKRHEPPLCGCPNCGQPHLVSKCPFSGVSEGEEMPRLDYREPWKQCPVCQICHQGICPCAKCGELAHIAVDCIVAGIQEWSNSPTTRKSKRDQVSPEKLKHRDLNKNQMWCGKCGVYHQPNETCRYPDVSKALWFSSCGNRQNDHIKGCPTEKGPSMMW